MKSLRIFISSPGDVVQEREKAKLVISALQRHYGSAVELVPVIWESLALSSSMPFQTGIEEVLDLDTGIDIAVFILWSRLGTPLVDTLLRPDGSPYLSGTEREFDLMVAASEKSGGQRPVILTYTRRDDEEFSNRLDASKLGDDALAEVISQRKLVKKFLRENFQDAQGRNLRAYHSYHEPVGFAEKLHVHLRAAIERKLEAGAVSATWTEDPYRSLEVFDVRHAPIFCGRDEETCELLQRLRDQRQEGCAFVCIVGASGAGKSSLARAGVTAALSQRSFDDGVKQWRHAVFLPGWAAGDLPSWLAQVIAGALPELCDGPGGLGRLVKFLRDRNLDAAALSMEAALEAARAGAGGEVRLLLVLDQMEELWTDANISPRARERFLETLEAFARAGLLTILATLRSDFYPQAQLSQAFLRMKSGRGHFDLVPPGPAALREIIVQPAARTGFGFERDVHTGRTLDERILSDAIRDPSALPLLQYALAELHSRRDEGSRQLTFSAYEAMGGVEGSLGHRAAQTFDALPAEARSAFDELLPLLVSVDTAGEQNAVRRRARLSELTGTKVRKDLTDALIKARFLTTDDRDGTPVVALAHEALLRRWERIASWINANRDFLRMRARIGQYQAIWEDNRRESSLLLGPGLPVEEGRKLLSAAPHLPDAAMTEYIRLSEQHLSSLQRKNARTRVAVMAVLATFAIVAVFGGLVAWVKQREARDRQKEAVAQQQIAQQAFLTSRDTVDYFLNTFADQQMNSLPGFQESAGRMIDRAVTTYSELLARKPDDAAIQVSLLQAKAARANISEQGETYAKALQIYEDTLAEMDRLRAMSPESRDIAVLTARTRLDLRRFLSGNQETARGDVPLDETIKLLKPFEGDRGARIELVRAYNLRGNGGSDPAKRFSDYETSRHLALSLYQEDPSDANILRFLSAATHNLGREHRWAPYKNPDKAIALMEEAERYCGQAVSKRPHWAQAKQDLALGYMQKAQLYGSLPGRSQEATSYFEKAVSGYRELNVLHPDSRIHRWNLAYCLRSYGNYLNDERDQQGALECFRESRSLLETLVMSRENRPAYGVEYLQIMDRLAEFGARAAIKGLGTGESPDTIRDGAIDTGALLVAQHPQSRPLAIALAGVYYSRAGNSRSAEPALKARLAIEGMELTRPFIQTGADRTEAVTSYLQHAVNLGTVLTAQSGGKIERRPAFDSALAVAMELGPECATTDLKRLLMEVGSKYATLLRADGKPSEAADLCRRMIAIGEPALKEKPYLYYLRDALAGNYRGLAEACAALRDGPGEFAAIRTLLRECTSPMTWADLKAETAETLAYSPENLALVKAAMDSKTIGTKIFTVPCMVNGLRTPIQFLMPRGNPPHADADPVADQARWLEEERGITVPPDVRESLVKLSNIAFENKVSFADLCDYALDHETALNAVEQANQNLKRARSARLAAKNESDRKNAAEFLCARLADFARAQILAGDFNGAAATLAEARKEDDTLELQIAAAHLLLAKRDFDGAILAYEASRARAVKEQSLSSWHRLMSVISMEMSADGASLPRWDEVRGKFVTPAGFDPAFDPARSAAREVASRAYQQAASLPPEQWPAFHLANVAEIYVQSAGIFLRNGKRVEAVGRLAVAYGLIWKAAERDRDRFLKTKHKIQVQLALQLLLLDRAAEVDELAAQILQEDPNSVDGNRMMAHALMFTGKTRESLPYYARGNWKTVWEEFGLLRKANIRPAGMTEVEIHGRADSLRDYAPKGFTGERLVFLARSREPGGAYCYVKPLPGKLPLLIQALEKGGRMNLANLGEVLETGEGNPTEVLRKRMVRDYKVIEVGFTPTPESTNAR